VVNAYATTGTSEGSMNGVRLRPLAWRRGVIPACASPWWCGLLVLFGCCCAAVRARDSLDWLLPVRHQNRKCLDDLELTEIGGFCVIREARPGIPAHMHTGIDIRRPSDNYENEPVFPAARGLVVSFREDGPFAQIILEHVTAEGDTLWTVYEHVSGIGVRINEVVIPQQPIARFMSEDELNRYGRHFDHLHFEIMKSRPIPVKPGKDLSFRRFRTYGLHCGSIDELQGHYIDPLRFLEDRLRCGNVPRLDRGP